MSRAAALQLTALSLVFVGPVLLAALAFYGPWQWAPQVARGDLIEPPAALPPGLLHDEVARPGAPTARWSFIYARSTPCRDACLEHMLRMYQVRLALAEDRDHLQLVLLFDEPLPETPLEPTWRAVRREAALSPAVHELLSEQVTGNGRIYVADPLGNLILSYPPDAGQKDMLEDLERLLQLSVVD